MVVNKSSSLIQMSVTSIQPGKLFTHGSRYRSTEVLKGYPYCKNIISIPIYCVNSPFCIPLHTCKNIFKILKTLKTQNSQKSIELTLLRTF